MSGINSVILSFGISDYMFDMNVMLGIGVVKYVEVGIMDASVITMTGVKFCSSISLSQS